MEPRIQYTETADGLSIAFFGDRARLSSRHLTKR